MALIALDQFGEQLTQRVGCHHIYAWLLDLGETLGTDINEVLPMPPKSRHILEWPDYGLTLVLAHKKPDAELDEMGNYWVIEDALLKSTWPWAWPFGLDPHTASPQIAASLLGSDTSGLGARAVAEGDLRQSYFQPDGLTAQMTWRATLIGFDAMHLCRLGLPLNFDDQS